jgi:hypothetical protein
MYNEDFVQRIISERGREAALIYCELEAERNDLIVREYKYMKTIPYDQYMDSDYERNWWKNRAEKLKNQLENEH